jgi:hypothetical protein
MNGLTLMKKSVTSTTSAARLPTIAVLVTAWLNSSLSFTSPLPAAATSRSASSAILRARDKETVGEAEDYQHRDDPDRDEDVVELDGCGAHCGGKLPG